MAVSFGDIQGSAGGVQSNERRPVGATVRCVAPKYAVSPPVLRPDESFGWGCLRGLHSDRGSPNLTLRLALEAKLSRRLVQTWDLRHRGFLLQKAVSAAWAPAARVAAGAEEEGMEVDADDFVGILVKQMADFHIMSALEQEEDEQML